VLSGCQVANVGERVFACSDAGTCPDGFTCSAEDGLCLLTGELCAGAIDADGEGEGPFDVTFEGDLSRFTHDQDAPFCSPAARGADVFYNFAGSGPFSATVTPVGSWRPMVSIQKCDLSTNANTCREDSVSDPQLDPGFWRVVVSSVSPGGGPYSVRIKGVRLAPGDYCGAAVRLNFTAGADGGLSASASFDSSATVSWPQGLWQCGGSLQRHDAVFIARQRADGGQVVARTSAPFRHWVQWRANDPNCFAAEVIRCSEAVNQGDGGWRATASGPSLAGGDAWLWVGGVGDGGVYDVQVELR
jgi:hypothetical protein